MRPGDVPLPLRCVLRFHAPGSWLGLGWHACKSERAVTVLRGAKPAANVAAEAGTVVTGTPHQIAQCGDEAWI
jgi:hypothetical protein